MQADNLSVEGKAKIKTNSEKLRGGEYQDKNFEFSCGPIESKKDSRMELSLKTPQFFEFQNETLKLSFPSICNKES